LSASSSSLWGCSPLWLITSFPIPAH
jgi:hypothetical protein